MVQGECGVRHSLFARGGRCGLLLFLAGFKGVPDNLNSIPERGTNTRGGW